MFTMCKWLAFSIQQTWQIHKMTTTNNNIDYYIMKVIFVYLNAYGSSSLHKVDFNYSIVFFSTHKITVPAIFLRYLLLN